MVISRDGHKALCAMSSKFLMQHHRYCKFTFPTYPWPAPSLTCQCVLVLPPLLHDLLFWQEHSLPFSASSSNCPLTSNAAGISVPLPHLREQLLEEVEKGSPCSCWNGRTRDRGGSSSVHLKVSGRAARGGECVVPVVLCQGLRRHGTKCFMPISSNFYNLENIFDIMVNQSEWGVSSNMHSFVLPPHT